MKQTETSNYAHVIPRQTNEVKSTFNHEENTLLKWS